MDFPPGFRFYPTEEELVLFYLHHKLGGRREDLNQVIDRIIPVLDIYEHNPWDLPQFAGGGLHNTEVDPEQWFFFNPRQESETRGGRPKRLTNTGYWKATGSPGHVYSNNRIIGLKRTMVFYTGRAPNGRKTEWKMNEYKAIVQGEASSSSTTANPKLRHEFSLCRVYKKSKSLRAFDRRPVGVDVVEARRQPASGNEATSSSHHQNQPRAERTRSPESSSSGDNGNPSQTAGDSLMSTGDDAFWGTLEFMDWNGGQD